MVFLISNMFWRKKNLLNRTLGERLREIREESNLTLEDIQRKIGVSKKYIEYLEQSRYEMLPGDVYVRSFLKKYVAVLRINEEKVFKLYQGERKVAESLVKQEKKIYFPPKSKVNFTPFTPKFFRNIIIAVLVLGILVYLGWELFRVISPPALSVTYPPDRLVTESKNLKITGQTEPESKVLVNGKEVYVDSRGHFQEEIVLKEGINVIKVSAYKKQGKESVVSREILYKN